MADPIALGDGNAITNWDANTIEVTGPAGITRIARAAAPPRLQQALTQAEGLGAAPGQSANAFGIIQDPATGAMSPAPRPAGGGIGGGGLGSPAALMEPATPEEQVAAAGGGDELAPYDAEIARLRAAPQYAYSPGVTKTTTQTTKPGEEGAAAARELGTDAQLANEAAAQSAEREGEALAEGEREVADILQAQVEREGQQVSDLHTDEARFKERYDAELGKLGQLNEEARAKIDPKRWWKEKGTGEQILAALAIGLGGFGDRLLGRPNGALEQINKIIERDIDAQMENRSGKRDEANAQVGFMQLLKGQYQTEQDEKRAGIILGREYAANLADYQARLTNSEVIKEQKLQQAQALRAQNARDAQQLALQTAGSTTTHTAQVGGGLVQTAAGKAADQLSKAVYGEFKEELMIPGSERVLGVPMRALTKENANELSNGLARAQVLMSNTQKLKTLYKEGSGISPTDLAEAERLRSAIVTDLNTVAKLGALSQGDAKFLLDQIGPNKLQMSTIANVLPGFEADLRSRISAELGNKAVRVDPSTVPLAWRQRMRGARGGAMGAPPPTQPLGGGG